MRKSVNEVWGRSTKSNPGKRTPGLVLEKKAVESALRRADGNIKLAAKRMGVGYNKLFNFILKEKINAGKFKVKKNPNANPSEYKCLDENLAHGKLPTEGFISYAPDTYQILYHSEPLKKDYVFSAVFLPKSYWEGRGVMGVNITSLDPILKSKDKTLVAGLQYQVHKDRDAIEVHFMATKSKFRKKGIMRCMVDEALKKHKVSNVEYWEPTAQGKKFAKKFKKNPQDDSFNFGLYSEIKDLVHRIDLLELDMEGKAKRIELGLEGLSKHGIRIVGSKFDDPKMLRTIYDAFQDNYAIFVKYVYLLSDLTEKHPREVNKVFEKSKTMMGSVDGYMLQTKLLAKWALQAEEAIYYHEKYFGRKKPKKNPSKLDNTK